MPTPHILHRCLAALPRNAGDSAEGEIQLFPAGEFYTTDGRGPFYMTATVAAEMIRWFDALKRDISIDYEHQTLHSKDNGLPVFAAGWQEQLVWKEAIGLFAKVKWTPKAQAAIKSDEYRYISPVFATAPDGKTILPVLFPAALTNNPAIDGMAQAHAASQPYPSSEPPKMDLKKLAALLGLPETATEDEVIAKIKAMSQPQAASVDTSQYVPVAAVQQLQAQLATLSTSVQKSQVQSIVAASLANGKLPKALEPWALTQTPDALNAYLANAPVIPALTGMQTATAGTPEPVTALNAAELEVCSRLGLTQDAFRATKATLVAAQQPGA